ncbi:nucleoside-diphosphate sugar epimerase [Canicola haemoglobinophilus]|uniref:Wbfy protein n=1 Tax=Canicola haemoglobinophilus TaxID=733 RepID=A0A1V4AZG0_9PAST|nr:nucleoside-diphosphate sugar epimerase/dehydratase [Canicola haemoglobinophilus]OOR98517.1 nucleoside-diphosphate sugar epimerase [Canicola haemoglobinophilus]STO60066.1 wbfy protein [Canicola haemoglobinophilus]
MVNYLLGLKRSTKLIISLMVDIVLISCSYFIALGIRYDSSFSLYSDMHWLNISIVTIITLIVFIKLGLYRAVLRFVTIKIVNTVLIGALLSTVMMLLGAYTIQLNIPRTVPLLYFIFLSILIIGTRLLFRSLINIGRKGKKSVIIYGAGDSGRQLLTALNQMNSYFVAAFVDDNRKLHKLTLHGIRVYSPNDLDRLLERYDVQQILLAIPSAPLYRRKEIINNIIQLKCEVLSVPGIEDIVTGKAKLTTLNKVSIDDLLGREAVKPIPELLSANIESKAVLVTGAGGSIGSELCRQIICLRPNKLVLFELNEFSLYSIESELRNLALSENLEIELYPVIGTIQNREYLLKVIRSFNIDTIYHAAAYKHVPLVEYNVIEGVRNNIFGTLSCALAAIEANVETFVLISTDKAVRPTNTMGTTKRVAELILQALAVKQSGTRFCMVRFGNVLDSSGSVVPLFRKQIEKGGPITLTHRDITRYFMTIPEASQLVIQAEAMGKGGDIFVLDMGESIKIIDLARRMIQLSGLTEKSPSNLHGDIEIKITGLRPGEKLYEELLIGDNVEKTTHPRIMTAKEVMLDWNILDSKLRQLEEACNEYNLDVIRKLLIELPVSFHPVDEICDLIWKESQKLNKI